MRGGKRQGAGRKAEGAKAITIYIQRNEKLTQLAEDWSLSKGKVVDRLLEEA